MFSILEGGGMTVWQTAGKQATDRGGHAVRPAKLKQMNSAGTSGGDSVTTCQRERTAMNERLNVDDELRRVLIWRTTCGEL